MNVFILNSGRCGSTTFIKACQHITNYTSAHESLSDKLGSQRLDYPSNHIEADNRLSWILGRLDRKYSDAAFYVYLKRNPSDTTASFSKRGDFGIMKAYREGILLGNTSTYTDNEVAADYLSTIEENIRLFLENKSHVMQFNLETAKDDFQRFWNNINAEGDLEKALNEWDTQHNASAS